MRWEHSVSDRTAPRGPSGERNILLQDTLAGWFLLNKNGGGLLSVQGQFPPKTSSPFFPPGTVRILHLLLFFLTKINSIHPFPLPLRGLSVSQHALNERQRNTGHVASLLQASDQLICVNHLVCSKSDGDIIYPSVECITLSWFPPFLIPLISSEIFSMIQCDQTTQAERRRSPHKTAGRQPDSIHRTINRLMEQHWRSKQMGIQVCAAQTGSLIISWLCLLANKSLAAMRKR